MSVKSTGSALKKKSKEITVGLYLRSLREADSISQAAFAKKLRISKTELSQLETGKKQLSPRRAIRLGRLLKLKETILVRLLIQDVLRRTRIR